MSTSFITSLFHNDGHIFIGATFLNKSLSLIIAVILTRQLTVVDYSLLSFYIACISVAAPLFSLGANQAILRHGSLVKDSGELLRYASGKLTVLFTLYLFVTIWFTLFVYFNYDELAKSSKINLYICIYAFLVIQSLSSYLLASIRVMDGNKKYSLYTILTSVITLLAIIIFVNYWSVVGYFYALILAQSLLLIALYRATNISTFNGGITSFSLRDTKIFFVYGLSIVATNLVSQLALNVDILMIGQIGNTEQLGTYRNASILIVNLLMISAVVVSSQFVEIVRMGDKDMTAVMTFYRNYMYPALLFAAIIMVVIFICADWIVTLLFGERYLKSADILRILCLMIAPGFLVRTPIGNILSALGLSAYNLVFAIFAVCLNAALNIYLIPLYGIEGAAVATVISLYISSVLYVLALRRVTNV